MKVCAITTWPPYREGIAIYSAKLYPKIAKHVQVEIIANKINHDKSVGTCKATSINLKRSWTRSSPLSLLQIFSELTKSKPSIIHIQHGWFLYGRSLTVFFFPFFVLLLRLSRRPVIVTMHTIIKRDVQLFQKKVLNDIMNMAIFVITNSLVASASKVIVHSTLMKKMLEENYNCKKNKVIVIPHGVDKAEKRKCPQTTSSNSKQSNILSIGFLRESKGVETLLEAFHKLHLKYPSIRLRIVGSGHPHDNENYVEKVRTMAVNMQSKGEIVLLNFVEEELLNKLINEAEIVVLLSQETDLVESSGTLARVADFEKPVICSKVPKFQSELIDGYDCIMVNPGDSAEIYAAMEVLVKAADTRKSIASNLRKRFSNRCWDDIAKRHVELYRSFFHNLHLFSNVRVLLHLQLNNRKTVSIKAFKN